MKNRKQRRAAVAAARKVVKEDPAGLVAGYRWKQRMDPDDDRFVLFEMRMATQGMPDFEYEGAEAADRLERFCFGFVEGYQAEEENKIRNENSN